MRPTIIILFFCCLLSGLPAAAQESLPVLSLETGAAQVQTGQFYDVTVRLDGAADIWLLDAALAYDPSLIYVVGTESGSPVKPGTLFDPTAVVLFNETKNGRLRYLVSQLAPSKPVSGGGVVGTFRIYPLSAGTAQLTFNTAELVRIASGSGEATATPEKLNAAVTVLELKVVGDTVQPPSEATATPSPTETPMQVVAAESSVPTPTLMVVTAAPRTPVPLATIPVPAQTSTTSSSLVLFFVIGLIAIAAVGLVVLVVLARRRR